MKNILTITVGIFLLLAASFAGAAQYQLTGLGVLGGELDESVAYDVNDLGQVVGWARSMNPAVQEYRGFLWENGVMTDLGILPGDHWSVAYGVNNNGRIVGESLFGDGEAFLWESGSMNGLGDLPGGTVNSSARAINDADLIVGVCESASGQEACSWQGTSITGLGDFPGGAFASEALDCNAAGQIVGSGTNDLGTEAALWDGAGMTGLGELPGGVVRSTALAINNLGQVVGIGWSANGPEAFLWEAGSGMIGLGDLPGSSFHSEARDINDFGQAVGMGFENGSWQAIVWDAAGGMVNLNTLVDSSGAGWQLMEAFAINNNGQIAGSGVNPGGMVEGFLLTPAPACISNTDCPATESFCNKADGDCSGEGACEAPPTACSTVYAPVCGCDGITYTNDCVAAEAGVNIDYYGECTTGCPFWYADADGDGYGDPLVFIESCTQPPGYVLNADDCDDSEPAANPGEIEVCDDTIDNDCDGLVDTDDPECPACQPTAGKEKGKTCRDGIDNDCDGQIDGLDSDCGDGGDTGGSEGKGKTCSDGEDNDGDTLIDCADPDCAGNKSCR